MIPRSGDELRQRWLAELAGLGYRDRDTPIQLALQMPGALDRDAAVAEVVTRLGAARSAWNAADVRGQVEQLLARTGIVADAAVRIELAEDLTARAVEVCVPLHERATPEHIRALTSRHVLDVEADLVARLAARRGPAGPRPSPRSRRRRSRGWTRVSGPRSPRWPATRDWSWWRARPARARPPPSPRPGTRWPRSTDDWSW